MRRLALCIAVAAFFGLGIVGAASGVAPWVCAMRALAGAAAIYILARLAGGAFLDMIVEAALRRFAQDQNPKDRTRERGN
jgi:hypothetical protein